METPPWRLASTKSALQIWLRFSHDFIHCREPEINQLSRLLHLFLCIQYSNSLSLLKPCQSMFPTFGVKGFRLISIFCLITSEDFEPLTQQISPTSECKMAFSRCYFLKSCLIVEIVHVAVTWDNYAWLSMLKCQTFCWILLRVKRGLSILLKYNQYRFLTLYD